MPDTPRPEASRTNWAMLRSRSDQDIERLAAEDADNPATTEEDWADAVIGLPVLKTPVNTKFDADVDTLAGALPHQEVTLRHSLGRR